MKIYKENIISGNFGPTRSIVVVKAETPEHEFLFDLFLSKGISKRLLSEFGILGGVEVVDWEMSIDRHGVAEVRFELRTTSDY